MIKEIFAPHSHDAADSVDDTLESTAAGIRTVKISLLVLGLTALIQIVIVVMSGSVALAADTIHNFADALTAVPLWIAFALGAKPATRRYTYGFGRVEDLAGSFVVAMITMSAIIAGYEAIARLIHPQQIEHVGWVALAGLVGFIGNEWVALYRIRVGHRIGSAALIADGLHARTDGFTSLAVLCSAGGVALGFPLADPIVGLLITAAILAVLRTAARDVFRRLLDGVDPAMVDAAEQALAARPGVQAVRSVRMRWIGHRLHAVCWNTSFTVGFTGLARIDPAQKKSTSEWLAETLCDYASFEDGVDALRYWASGQIGQLPTGKGWEDKRLGIIIAGFDRRRIPLVAEISNFDPEAPIPANQNEFKCYRIRRAPGHSASFRITGAALTEKMYANILLRRVPRMLKQQDGITRAARLMVALQRRISEDNPGVGRHAMAVAIPRERTMPAVLSNLDAPSLNTMNSNFCYFDDAGFNYKQLGPHMAGGGWAWADFVAEADPSNPDMQKVGGRVLKCPQPPPQAESTGC